MSHGIRRAAWGLVAGALLVQGSLALALVDVQLLAGRRWYEVGDDKDGSRADEVNLSAHLDPIPLVPLSFGLSLSTMLGAEEKYATSTSNVDGSELGLEVSAWLPLVPVITPYVKVRYIVWSLYKNSGSTQLSGVNVASDREETRTGHHLNIGAKYSLMPLLSLMVEAGMGFQKGKIESQKFGGISSTPDSSETVYDSKVLLVGIEAGF